VKARPQLIVLDPIPDTSVKYRKIIPKLEEKVVMPNGYVYTIEDIIWAIIDSQRKKEESNG